MRPRGSAVLDHLNELTDYRKIILRVTIYTFNSCSSRLPPVCGPCTQRTYVRIYNYYTYLNPERRRHKRSLLFVAIHTVCLPTFGVLSCCRFALAFILYSTEKNDDERWPQKRIANTYMRTQRPS